MTVVASNVAGPLWKLAPQVIPRAVPSSLNPRSNFCPRTGVPVKLVVIDVIAVPKLLKLTTSNESVLIAGVAPGAGVAVERGLTHLLVSVWVSVVPTTVPLGAVTAVIADVPFPSTNPVNVPAPVPPRLTASVPVQPNVNEVA